nr:hypothetical protein [Tanacetum cinerariifolium]
AAGQRGGVFEALGVGDARAGRHPVYLAGADNLLYAQAVAVRDLAAKQVAHRAEPDVWVRQHVEGRHLGRGHQHRPGVVHKNKRPQHAPQAVGQDALHGKARREGRRPGINNEVEHGRKVARTFRFALQQPAHLLRVADGRATNIVVEIQIRLLDTRRGGHLGRVAPVPKLQHVDKAWVEVVEDAREAVGLVGQAGRQLEKQRPQLLQQAPAGGVVEVAQQLAHAVKLLVVRDELGRLYRKLEVGGCLRVPVFEKGKLRKAVKRNVQFERAKVLAVVLKPAPHGQLVG